MKIINTVIDQLKSTADSTVAAVSAAYNKVAPIATSTANSAVEGYSATKDYAAGLVSTTKATWHGLKTAYSTLASLAHLSKGALYDAPRMGVNHLYYKDEAATKAAKEAGAASLSAAGVELVEAYKEATAMLSDAYAATLSNINGLVHTKDSVYYAGDATVKSVTLAIEGGCLAYQGAKAAYGMLPAYSSVCEAATQALDNMLPNKPASEASALEMSALRKIEQLPS